MTTYMALSPHEGVKSALQTSLQSTFLQRNFTEPYLQNISVLLDYPVQEEDYPCMWLRMSFNVLQQAGLAMEQYDSDNNMYQTWRFEGTSNIQVFALTNLERDRISDALISVFAFGTTGNLTSNFQNQLNSNNYIDMTICSDQLKSGGQGETVGVPWQDDLVCYTDNYSFKLVGDFRSSYINNVGAVILSTFDVEPTYDGVGNPLPVSE